MPVERGGKNVEISKRKPLILGVVLAFIIIAVIGFRLWYAANPQFHSGGIVAGPYHGQEYADALGNSEAYQLRVNKFGYVIFENPSKGFEQIQTDCREAIEYIKANYSTGKFSRWNWEMYEVYGDQLDSDNQTLFLQGQKLSLFLGIYAHSFATS